MNNNSNKREVIHRKQQNTGECHEATAWTSFLQRNPQIVYTVQTIVDWFVTKASFAHYKSDHGGPVTTVNEVPNWLFILTFTTFFLSQISLFSWHFDEPMSYRQWITQWISRKHWGMVLAPPLKKYHIWCNKYVYIWGRLGCMTLTSSAPIAKKVAASQIYKLIIK